MKIIQNCQRNIFWLVFVILSAGCDDLLEVDRPRALTETDVVFQDDLTANAAVTGMYAAVMNDPGNFASGSNQSVTAMTSLSSDEFANYQPSNLDAIQFYENNLRSNNLIIGNLWRSAYGIIYQANSIIAGLAGSTTVTSEAKNQYSGEALFMRAFCHFYLVNLFGDIPMALTTDYRVTSKLPRIGVNEVYEQIISDLVQAQNLLQAGYPSAERVRPNKAVATALLARVYMYRQDWVKAEEQSSLIISNSSYQLETDLNKVFLAVSREAIWQLRPTNFTTNTWEGSSFILSGVPTNSYLTPEFVEAFESGDNRLTSWVASITASSFTFHYPFKFKIKYGGPGSAPPVAVTEYSMVFRLAEQYLIRAEVRAKLGKLGEAIEDLDMVRERAGLLLIQDINPSISQEELLLAIYNERRSEFFAEWGHRWFDIKRNGMASDVLTMTKPDWSSEDLLYPIPANEFLKNPLMGDQNPGY